jgi:hypothetical protein
VSTLLVTVSAAWSASPSARVSGVQDYAQTQSAGGADMLGLTVVAIFGLISLAVFGAAMRQENGKVKVRSRR